MNAAFIGNIHRGGNVDCAPHTATEHSADAAGFPQSTGGAREGRVCLPLDVTLDTI